MTKRNPIIVAGVLISLLAVLLLAGLAPAAAQSEGRIAGIVFADKNGNGIREEGEEGIKDVRIRFETAGWDTTINTAADGSFSIDLNPATWTVKIVEVPSGYQNPTATQGTKEVVIAAAGDAKTDLAFGLLPEGTVLPDSGGPVPGEVIVGGLIVLLVLGVALIVMGQRRSRTSAL